MLGTTRNSFVFLAAGLRTGEKAVFEYFRENMTGDNIDNELTANQILSTLSYVVTSVLIVPRKGYFMPFCNMSDVQRYIENENVPDESTVKQMLYDVRLGLNEIHSMYWIHRDIKLHNLLLNSSSGPVPGVRIGDLGYAVPLGKDEKLTEIVGTIPYMAPELLEPRPYSRGVDRAYGVVM